MLRSRRSSLTALLALVPLVLAGLIVTSPAARAANADVRINEFSSNNPDFVELINTGGGPVDLSGWVLKDNTENNSYIFPAGSSIGGGEITGISGEGVDFVFGLGNGDAVRLFAPGGDLIDSFTYPAHPPAGKSYGRCPDGSGAIGITVAATKGLPNACTTPDTAVRINEFSSNNPDFVELINTGGGPVDLSGWVLKDNTENNSYIFPAGSSIGGGEITGISGEGVDFVFGLGNGDAVRLFAPGGDLIDSFTYPAHPPAGKSYGRCPDGTGSFVITASATKGAANACPLPAGAVDVKVNEVRSDPDDIVELTNVGSAPVDLGGYLIKDNDDTHVFTIASGTTLAPGGFATFDVNPAFGLGKGDSVRLYTPDGATLLDSTTYPAATHATTWGRCPDGTGSFTTMAATLGAANQCEPGSPVVPDVVVNEVESNGDQVADWVELKNRSAGPVDVSGWKIVDGDPEHAATPVLVPATTVIPAGGYYAIYTEIAQSPGFGLGVGDSVNLYLADGTTLVDTTTWGAHPPTTWGRCPDGTGVFGNTTTSTRGLANACSPIRINEIESSGGVPGDWIELKNISSAPVDVSGWSVKDNGETPYPIPAGTTIAANGYLVVEEAQLPFGLGGADAVRLFDNGGALIEQYAWTTAATQTYGRCKDGVGQIVDTKAPSKGAVNLCPGLETQPWPGPQTVGTADLAATFNADLSGLAFDPADPDVLWAAQNKKGTLHKLERNAEDTWVPAAGWPRDPKFADGTGSPDSEGITIGPDGFVYLTSERNNDASGVSRNAVLRFDPDAPAGSTIVPTTEWNLTPLLPAVGANLGIEGITFVPDSYLVSRGFRDQSTHAPYDPATYPLHGSGLFLVAYENDGKVYAFALDSDGTPHLVATIDSGFPNLADVTFDPERERVWAVTDDTHDGKHSLLTIAPNGDFAVDVAYERPAAMPNLNNEGMAIAAQSECENGLKEVLWSDDGDTDGFSLRRGRIGCTDLPEPQTVEFTTPAPTGAVVGNTYTPAATGGASGNPVVFSIDPASAGVCLMIANTVLFTGAGACTIDADQAAAPGYLAGSASQTVQVGKAGIVVKTKASSGLVTLLTLRINYSTTVTSAVTGQPVAGVPVTTKLDGYKAGSGCTAVTDARGVATCTAGPINIALGIPFTATAAETTHHLGGTGTARNSLL